MLTSDCLTIRSREAGKFCVINCCIDIGLEPLVPPFDFFSRVLSFLPSGFGLSRFFSSFLFSSFGFSFFTTSRFGSSFFRGSRFSAFFLLFSLGLFLKNDSIEAIQIVNLFVERPAVGILYQEAIFCLCCQRVRFGLGVTWHPIPAKVLNFWISSGLKVYIQLTQKFETSSSRTQPWRRCR